jgi:hypothetical protein
MSARRRQGVTGRAYRYMPRHDKSGPAQDADVGGRVISALADTGSPCWRDMTLRPRTANSGWTDMKAVGMILV